MNEISSNPHPDASAASSLPPEGASNSACGPPSDTAQPHHSGRATSDSSPLSADDAPEPASPSSPSHQGRVITARLVETPSAGENAEWAAAFGGEDYCEDDWRGEPPVSLQETSPIQEIQRG